MCVCLSIQDLCHTWNGSSSNALSDVDLEISSGKPQIFAGPSGSGKSTLALCIAGLEHPTTGKLRLEIDGVEQDRLGIPIVFQFPELLFLCDTVQDEFVSQGGMRLWREAQNWFERMGADANRLSSAHPFHLSVGMGRLIALVLQLSRESRVLVADEPTTSLDWKFRERVIDALIAWATPERLLIVITHDVDFMRRLGGHTHVFMGGRNVWTGETAAIVDSPELLERSCLV